MNFCSSFNYLIKLWYSNSSIIIKCDDVMKLSYFNICKFLLNPLHGYITKLHPKSYCSTLIMFVIGIAWWESFIR